MRDDMKRHCQRNVLICINIGGASGRDCLSGLLRRINAGMDWSVQLAKNHDDAMYDLSQPGHSFDGVVIDNRRYEPDFCARVMAAGVPAVFTNYSTEEDSIIRRTGDAEPKAVFIRLDDEEIGRLAARHFAALGAFGSWAFATNRHEAKYSQLRLRGFESEIKARGLGRQVSFIDFARGGMCGGVEMEKALARLPKPVAVFAAFDNVAIAVIDRCQAAGLAIPDQVAVLGVDNDEVVCENSSPTISSMLPDHVRLGARAAEELQRIMNGGRSAVVVMKNPCREIVTRGSTRHVPPAERLLRMAQAFIAENACKAISVSDVAAHLGVSRQLAERRFREIQGCTIHAAISAARVDEVKMRLDTTRETATEIAAKCGFPDVASLSHFFRRETGQSLSEWRRLAKARHCAQDSVP